ncbi:MAG: hypothetical protein HY071_04250 [Chloroflexi bacterium]|nr:hypothetical protein [Chloroflexota bacterium]
MLLGLLLGTLLLGIGIAIDTGQIYIARRAAQTAADAAAWGGAVQLFAGGSAASAVTAATTDATRNGYSSGVTAVSPPTTGNAIGDPFFIEVTITQSVTPIFFSGARSFTVRAVAGVTRTGSGETLHILDSSATANTLDLGSSGTARINALIATGSPTSSGIQVNTSGAVNAVRIGGTGGITAQHTRVVANPGMTAATAGKISPAAVVGASSVADPFYTSASVNLPGPPVGSLPVFAAVDVSSGSTTINPGIYNGGIRVTGTATVTMNPGVYILRGNYGACGSVLGCGFTVAGTTATVQMATATSGVLIYNTFTSYPAAYDGTNCGLVSFSSSAGNATLRAQAVGSYAGIVIYQDRNCSVLLDVIFASTGGRSVTGTIYAPTARLNVSGSNLTMSGQWVVRRYVAASTVVNLTFDSNKVAGGRAPALTE